MLNITEGLSYDDVLLVPQYSEIETRSSERISLAVKLPKIGTELKHPIIPANMKTVFGEEMAEAVYLSGGFGFLHRFMPIEDQLYIGSGLKGKFGHDVFNYIGFSVGVKKEDYENVPKLISNGAKIICIDIAHGDSKLCVDMCKFISTKYPDVLLVAGNVCTKAGAKRLWEASADIIKVGVGPGCFAAGTRILMSNGMYKNIEDVKSGDFIINKDGNPVKVLNSFCSGTKEVVKVRNNLFGQDTFVTPDHQFWIGDLNSTSKETISNVGYAKLLDKESKTVPRRSKYKWKSVGEMQQDVFLMPKNIKFEMPETFEIMLLKRTGGNWRSGPVYSDDVKIVPNYNSGYIFGTFLGDGNANVAVYKNSESGSVFWSFGLNEMYIAEKLSNALFNIFGKKPVIEKEDNIVLVKFHYKPLANFFNLFGKRDQKFLPQEYLVNNKEYLQGIFDGLVDSDGCYCKDGRTGFSNTSPQLIELFGVIAYILYGEFPNSEKPKITTGNLKGCNIENCKQSYFSRVLKNGKVRFTKDYQVVKFLEIEEIKKEVPVYDLEIDCDTHSFIANNMIVHNSLCSTRIETAAGVPQITALNNIYNMRNLCSRFEDKLIIADGGVKNSGDCVKGLCFADLVMAGNLFAGTEEAPGTKITKDGILYKEYAGSSTHKSSHIEGVTTFVPYKGTYQNVLTKLLEGIRSGCSYQGVDNLTDLKENPQFVKISSAGYRESIPHGVL